MRTASALALVAMALVGVGCGPTARELAERGMAELVAPLPFKGTPIRKREAAARLDAETRERCWRLGEWSAVDGACVVDLDDERNRHATIIRYTGPAGERVDTSASPPEPAR